MDFQSPGPELFWVDCAFCGVRYEFLVDPEGFVAWRDKGIYIQDALPDNTPAERELIRMQMCGNCFDKMCPPDEDD